MRGHAGPETARRLIVATVGTSQLRPEKVNTCDLPELGDALGPDELLTWWSSVQRQTQRTSLADVALRGLEAPISLGAELNVMLASGGPLMHPRTTQERIVVPSEVDVDVHLLASPTKEGVAAALLIARRLSRNTTLRTPEGEERTLHHDGPKGESAVVSGSVTVEVIDGFDARDLDLLERRGLPELCRSMHRLLSGPTARPGVDVVLQGGFKATIPYLMLLASTLGARPGAEVPKLYMAPTEGSGSRYRAMRIASPVMVVSDDDRELLRHAYKGAYASQGLRARLEASWLHHAFVTCDDVGHFQLTDVGSQIFGDHELEELIDAVALDDDALAKTLRIAAYSADGANRVDNLRRGLNELHARQQRGADGQVQPLVQGLLDKVLPPPGKPLSGGMRSADVGILFAELQGTSIAPTASTTEIAFRGVVNQLAAGLPSDLRAVQRLFDVWLPPARRAVPPAETEAVRKALIEARASSMSGDARNRLDILVRDFSKRLHLSNLDLLSSLKLAVRLDESGVARVGVALACLLALLSAVGSVVWPAYSPWQTAGAAAAALLLVAVGLIRGTVWLHPFTLRLAGACAIGGAGVLGLGDFTSWLLQQNRNGEPPLQQAAFLLLPLMGLVGYIVVENTDRRTVEASWRTTLGRASVVAGLAYVYGLLVASVVTPILSAGAADAQGTADGVPTTWDHLIVAAVCASFGVLSQIFWQADGLADPL